MEEWRDVVGYEGLYQVSNYGRVKSLGLEVNYVRKGVPISYKTKPKIMTPLTRNHGYLSVQLHKNGETKNISIHRLVANAFIPNPEKLGEVNHIDENKQNNMVDNLEWVTHKQNMNCGTLKERFRNRKPFGKPVIQIDKDGNVVGEYESARDAERKTNISHKIIFNSLSRKQYGAGYRWEYRKRG